MVEEGSGWWQKDRDDGRRFGLEKEGSGWGKKGRDGGRRFGMMEEGSGWSKKARDGGRWLGIGFVERGHTSFRLHSSSTGLYWEIAGLVGGLGVKRKQFSAIL